MENFGIPPELKDPMIKTTATRWFEENNYRTVKLPVNLENKTAVKEWLENIMYNAIFGPKYGYLDEPPYDANVKDRSAYSEDDEKSYHYHRIEHVVVDSIRAGKAGYLKTTEIVARGDKIKILPLLEKVAATSNIPPVVMKEFKRTIKELCGQEGQLKSDPELEVKGVSLRFKFDSFALTTKAKHYFSIITMSANIGVAKERLFLYAMKNERVSDAMIYIATQHLRHLMARMTAQWWAQWYTGQHYGREATARMPDVVRRVGVVSDTDSTIGKYACLIRNILTTKNLPINMDKQEKYKELIRSAVYLQKTIGKSFSDVKLKDENTNKAEPCSIDGDMQIIISQFRTDIVPFGALIAEEMEDEITDWDAAERYMGDFYHLAKYNDEFMRGFMLEFIRHYVGNCSPLVRAAFVDEVMEVVMYSAEFYFRNDEGTNFAEFKKCMELYNLHYPTVNRHYDTPSRVIDHLLSIGTLSTCRTATSFGNAGNERLLGGGAFSSPYTVIFNQSSHSVLTLRINKKNEQNAVKTLNNGMSRKRAVVKKEMYAAGAAGNEVFYLPEHVKRSKLAEFTAENVVDKLFRTVIDKQIISAPSLTVCKMWVRNQKTGDREEKYTTCRQQVEEMFQPGGELVHEFPYEQLALYIHTVTNGKYSLEFSPFRLSQDEYHRDIDVIDAYTYPASLIAE
ncbi:hypothetical protein SPFM15_00277 [Salmonella phage SPFM15]|nr:hypothetical protein SPFM5_00272 [Salmonella phage SPFM5]VFR13901.1 hypothetical protein SPFM15_00277 [Salmonella phage SPFM15]